VHKLKYFLLLFVTLTICPDMDAQSQWEFSTKVMEHDHFLLEGKINDQQEVLMFLQPLMRTCGSAPIAHLNDRIVRGWYQRIPDQQKIPLLGSMSGYDQQKEITLFVPDDALDTLSGYDCNLIGHKEVFISRSGEDLTQMEWKSEDMDNFLTVDLDPIHPFSYNTDAELNLLIDGISHLTINLTKESGISYVQDIEVLAAVKDDDGYFAILELGHPTKPGSLGHGHCGSGYEGYLAFLHIDTNLLFKELTIHQTESCYRDIDIDRFTYDPDHPELGILDIDK